MKANDIKILKYPSLRIINEQRIQIQILIEYIQQEKNEKAIAAWGKVLEENINRGNEIADVTMFLYVNI